MMQLIIEMIKEWIVSMKEVFKVLPQRYPFLLIDKIIQVTAPKERTLVGRQCEALKNVSINEPFFTGHFPDRPIMPGVMILEAMAQTAAICFISFNKSPERKEIEVRVAAVTKVRFRRPVIPGDQLKLSAEILGHKRGFIKFECHAYVGKSLVAEALITGAFATG